MKFAPLVLKHLRKNWIRTLCTVLAMSVCIFLFCTLQTVVEAVNFGLHSGNASRLVTRHYVSLVFNLPTQLQAENRRRARRERSRHELVVRRHLQSDPKNFFANIATEPEAFLEVYPEFMLPPDQKEKWLHDRRGAIVGRKLARALRLEGRRHLRDWRASFPPTEWDIRFDFVVDGIYDTDEAKYPGTDLNSMYFDYKYLYEATGRNLGIGWLVEKIDDPNNAGRNQQGHRRAIREQRCRNQNRDRAGLPTRALSPWRATWRSC